jgi:hypothetical protein
MDRDPALRVERHTAEWFRAQKIVPGAEVHDDPDVVWIVQPGSAWGNAGVMVRLSESRGADRLDAMVERYRRNGLGMGLWVSPHATPAGLTSWLQERRLHCRKHFPAMMRTTGRRIELRRVPGLKCHVIDDPSEFLATPHPSIGPITTPKRRYALTRLSALIAHRPQTTWGFIASLDGQAVGSSILFRAGGTALRAVEWHVDPKTQTPLDREVLVFSDRRATRAPAGGCRRPASACPRLCATELFLLLSPSPV